MTTDRYPEETYGYPESEAAAYEELSAFLRENAARLMYGETPEEALANALGLWQKQLQTAYGEAAPLEVAAGSLAEGYAMAGLSYSDAQKYTASPYFDGFRRQVLHFCPEATLGAQSFIFYKKGLEIGMGLTKLPDLPGPHAVGSAAAPNRPHERTLRANEKYL
jgi:hypothetical protein